MAKIFKYILDFEAQTQKFGKEIGGMKGMLKGAAVAAGALFAADKVMEAADAVFDYAKEISNVRTEIATLTGLTGAALDATTGQVQALASSYEQDVNETLKASNALMREFGITNKDAFDIMNTGFAEAANSSGDFLEQINEYSTHFREAGLDAEQMLAVISQGNKMGVFSDKSADAIKEGSIRLREMTQGTQDALNAIGLSSTQIQQDISSGNKSMFEVMQLVSKQLQSLPQQSPAVGQALADIFGGPGEDAVNFIRSLSEIDLTMQGVIDNATQAQIDWTNELAEFHTVGAQVFGGTSQMITGAKTALLSMANEGIKGLVNIANYFIDLYNESMVFRGAVEYIKLGFKNLWEIVKVPFQMIWNNLKTIGGLIKGIFTFDAGAIKEALASGFQGAADIARTSAENIADNYMDAWNNTLNQKKKIELISISAEDATVAGAIAGQAYANGVKNGMGMVNIDVKAASSLSTDIDTDLLWGELQDFQDVNKMIGQEFKSIGENIKVPAAINDYMDSLDQAKERQAAVAEGFASAFDAAGSKMIEGLGLASDGLEGFIATLLPLVLKTILAMQSQSMATAIFGATESAAGTGPAAVFTMPGFIASAIATIGAAFAAIPSFWSGGVVPGNSFSGDKVLARVNSGEEILRRTDPRHSSNMGQSTAAEPQVVVQTMIPTTRLRKGDIYLSFVAGEKEYQRRNGK